MANRDAVVTWLNQVLDIPAFPDYPKAVNGLQIEGKDEVSIVGFAVDASAASIQGAIQQGVDLLLVHHGLFWDGIRPITGVYRAILQTALRAGLNLYSAHLPLDGHPLYGNARCLADALMVDNLRPFGLFEGRHVGVCGRYDGDWHELCQNLQAQISPRPLEVVEPRVDAESPGLNVAIVTGSGGEFWQEAARQQCQVLLTGEYPHHIGVAARDFGTGLLAAGHYETEKLGVASLAAAVAKYYGLPVCEVGNTPWAWPPRIRSF